MGVGRMGEEESRFRAEAEPDWGLWAPEKGKQGKAGESEEPEESGLRSKWLQSRLPPRYPGEINGKNREPAGEGRGGRTRCEEVRTGVEGGGPGEKGRPRKGQGLRRLFARGPAGPGCLPGCARPRPSVRPLTPLTIPPPRRVRGNTLLGDFWYPSKCAAYTFPEPWRPLASSPYNLAGLPTRYAPGHGRDEDPHRAPLLSPNEGPGSQGTLTQRAVHQRELNGQTICAQRGGAPGEIWSQGSLPLKWEPHSQLTRLGVPRRRCSGVRRRERGRGGERRREIRREGGEQRRREEGA